MSCQRRWMDVVDHYHQLDTTADAADAVVELGMCEPDKYAPRFVWLAWHEVQTECWSRLAARDSLFIWYDQFIGGHHRDEVRRLKSRRFAIQPNAT